MRTEFTHQGTGPSSHAYNNPNLSAIEFLQAVMHCERLPLPTRLKAAKAPLPFTDAIPRPINHRIGCTIIIGGIPSEDLEPCDTPLSRQGCEPRTPCRKNSSPRTPEQGSGEDYTISQSFSVGRLNNHHPQSGPAAPVNMTMTSNSPTFI